MTHRFFSAVKIQNFIGKLSSVFNIFAPNIDCGYTLEPPQRGDSNEYHNLCFVSNLRKIGKSQFYYIKVGYEGIYVTWTCYPDVNSPYYWLILRKLWLLPNMAEKLLTG